MFSKRRIISNIFIIIGLTISTLLVFFTLGFFYINNSINIEDKRVVIPSGMTTFEIAELLENQSIISNKWVFFALVKLNKQTNLQAGEYNFGKNLSMAKVFDIIHNGRVIVHYLTIPEGYTNRQIVEKINSIDILTGEISDNYKEGTLMPSTYHYIYGDRKQAILEKMHESMMSFLKQEWQKREENLPYTNIDEALIMASIIEKETGSVSEQPRVAGVFVNRLRKNMKLQADPTVIYALTEGKFDLNRKLTKKDLKMPSKFNTYYIRGLPASPIANPGRSAINAALHPLKTNELYFVVDGKGGHNFSKDLVDHNNNVKKYKNLINKSNVEKK